MSEPAAPHQELGERLEEHLMAEGVYLTDYTVSEGTFHVAYETVSPEEGVPRNEMGSILQELLDAHAEGWPATDVVVWVYDADESADERDPKGKWETHEGWFRSYGNGNLSETDLSTLVISTVDVEATREGGA
jgi:hypothetical protein